MAEPRAGARWWVGLCLTALARFAWSADFVDDANSVVHLTGPARRVVSLAPNLTEIVFAVGGGARLVGVDSASDHPPQARSLPQMGDYQRVDIERLLALHPDLVLVWGSGNTQRELAQLQAAGVAVFALEPRRLADVPRAIERVAALLGLERAGVRQAARLRDELDAIGRAHADAAPVRVFYQVWARPLLTLNDDHLVSDVIRLCGGHNVFGGLKALVPEVSTESVLVSDPDAILSAEPNQSNAERRPDAPAFAAWRGMRGLTADRTGRMFTVPADTLTRQGPRLDEGARAVCAALDEVRRDGGPRR